MVYKNHKCRGRLIPMIAAFKHYPKGATSEQIRDVLCSRTGPRQKHGASTHEVSDLMQANPELFIKGERIRVPGNVTQGGSKLVIVWHVKRGAARQYTKDVHAARVLAGKNGKMTRDAGLHE